MQVLVPHVAGGVVCPGLDLGRTADPEQDRAGQDADQGQPGHIPGPEFAGEITHDVSLVLTGSRGSFVLKRQLRCLIEAFLVPLGPGPGDDAHEGQHADHGDDAAQVVDVHGVLRGVT
ncbi:hypothetical protein D9M70_610220 [compost metagenome]